ncbi:MAG: hypothetical protein WB509_17625 [Acetobacteraceae bacterium]
MHRIAWLIGALIVSGCTTSDLTDPYARPGTYNPTGVNDANLRTMVVNPHDLVEGTGQNTSTGAVAAPPVARLLAGKRYPLPDLNAASVNIVSEPAQQGAANPGSSQ